MYLCACWLGIIKYTEAEWCTVSHTLILTSAMQDASCIKKQLWLQHGSLHWAYDYRKLPYIGLSSPALPTVTGNSSLRSQTATWSSFNWKCQGLNLRLTACKALGSTIGLWLFCQNGGDKAPGIPAPFCSVNDSSGQHTVQTLMKCIVAILKVLILLHQVAIGATGKLNHKAPPPFNGKEWRWGTDWTHHLEMYVIFLVNVSGMWWKGCWNSSNMIGETLANLVGWDLWMEHITGMVELVQKEQAKQKCVCELHYTVCQGCIHLNRIQEPLHRSLKERRDDVDRV